jgi:hypothetical protein
MDELLFHNTDFDYAKYKEDKKLVNNLAKRVASSVTYKKGKYTYKDKEGWEDIVEGMSAQEIDTHDILGEKLADIRDWNKDLDATMSWDKEGAEARRELIKDINGFQEEFIRIYDNSPFNFKTKEQHELNRLNKDE